MKKFIGILACALLLMAAGAFEAKAKEAKAPPKVECTVTVGYQHPAPAVLEMTIIDTPAAVGTVLIAGEAEIVETRIIPEMPVEYIRQERSRSCENKVDSYEAHYQKPPIFHRDRLKS